MGKIQIKRNIGHGKLGVKIRIKYNNPNQTPFGDIEVLTELEKDLTELINKYKAENDW